MSVGGQSNAPQTPFSPNYRERRSVQPRGPGNAYTQRPGQQPNPQQPQLQPAPQPNQPPPADEPTFSTLAIVPATKDGVSGYYTDGSRRNFVPNTPFGGGFGGGYSSPFGGGFGGGYSSPFGGGFGGGYSTPFSDYGRGFGGGYGQPRQYGGGFGQPNQPPPGMELNPHYIDRFADGRTDTMDLRPTDNKFRPIQAGGGTDQPPPGMMLNPNYKELPEGSYRSFGGLESMKYVTDPNQPQPQTGGGYGGGYGNQFGGGYGGGYSSPYMSPSMMGGLASLFGGMQGGGFQGMFNPQSQAQAQMRAYQQNQQRDPNQPPPGMKLNSTYDAGYAMADDMPPPGSAAAIRKQQFIPI